MTRTVFTAFVAAGLLDAGCVKRLDVQCVQDSNCDLAPGGLCLAAPTGRHWCAYPDARCSTGYRYSDLDVGDGVGGACTTDVGTGSESRAPISSGEFADQVIGQNDLTSYVGNSGGISASSLNHPTAVAISGNHLWVTDASNARVLQWNSIPIVDRPLANVVIGQRDGSSMDSVTSRSTLRIGVSGTSASAESLCIADYPSNRVLIFSPVPAQNGSPASVVLGQGSFDTSLTGKSASALYNPYDVWCDGTRVIVADTANSRVLIWNSLPKTNGAPADVVLGRPNFGLGVGDAAADPPTSSSMKGPMGVWSNGTRLYVADSENHRVLIWSAFPTTNGAPADLVLGQVGFDQNAPNAGGANANALGFDQPIRAIEAGGALFVADRRNHRIVMFFPTPSTTGIKASGVLGQDGLPSSDVPGMAAGNRLMDPRYIAATSSGLYVPDYEWNRVTRFPFLK